MTRFDEIRAKVPGIQPKSSQRKARWLKPGEPVEVLWTDAADNPHVAKGRFKGLRIPDTRDGGPVQFIVDGAHGDIDLDAERVVGITPTEPPTPAVR